MLTPEDLAERRYFSEEAARQAENLRRHMAQPVSDWPIDRSIRGPGLGDPIGYGWMAARGD